MRTGRQASIVASPVLIGALTMLVIIVAVFLAYNANAGLPFVPTFDVKAELEGGQNLVVSNDVRVGGARVGLVDRLEPGVNAKTGRTTAIVHMKLDKKIEPIPKDTRVYVRPRSNLGLKYIEVSLGRSTEALRAGDTIPIAQSRTPIELDEFFSTNTEEHRQNTQEVLEGFGNALAGRGESINIAIREFVPFFTHLTPVMTTLSDPRTRLDLRGARPRRERAPPDDRARSADARRGHPELPRAAAIPRRLRAAVPCPAAGGPRVRDVAAQAAGSVDRWPAGAAPRAAVLRADRQGVRRAV
jgi:MlaD protein